MFFFVVFVYRLIFISGGVVVFFFNVFVEVFFKFVYFLGEVKWSLRDALFCLYVCLCVCLGEGGVESLSFALSFFSAFSRCI